MFEHSTSFLINFFAGIPFFIVHIPHKYMFFLFPANYPPNLNVILEKKKKAWFDHLFSVSPHLTSYRQFLLQVIWMVKKQINTGIPSSPSDFFGLFSPSIPHPTQLTIVNNCIIGHSGGRYFSGQ